MNNNQQPSFSDVNICLHIHIDVSDIIKNCHYNNDNDEKEKEKIRQEIETLKTSRDKLNEAVTLDVPK